MEEFIQNLMNSWVVNKAGQLEFSIKKTIESWNLEELFTVSNTTTSKGV